MEFETAEQPLDFCFSRCSVLLQEKLAISKDKGSFLSNFVANSEVRENFTAARRSPSS